MRGKAIPEGNDKIFQKKKQFFIFYFFFSQTFLKKKMLKEKYIWDGWPPTKCPRVAAPPLGPSGVAGHPFDFSIFFLFFFLYPPQFLLGVARPPLVHACGWLATHLIF
jgi:hypothetical protein